MDDARHELMQIDGELAAKAIVRRAKNLQTMAIGTTLLVVASSFMAGGSFGLIGRLISLGGIFVAGVAGSVANLRAKSQLIRAGELEALSRTPEARAALVGDDLEIVTPTRTLRLPATRAELRRLRIGALPAARVHELR